MNLRMITTVILSLFVSVLGAQTRVSGGKTVIDNKVEFDRTVHDFGEILISDGAKAASFTVKNISSAPLVILTVVSSCGCTDVKWTRESLASGKTGTIRAVYSNDQEGAFDKTLTVYLSSVKKPVVLRLRGVSSKKKRSIQETYPVVNGPLGFMESTLRVGNLSQGGQKSNMFRFANLGNEAAVVSFSEVSPGLELAVSPNPVPPGEVAGISAVVTADRTRWGMTQYSAVPLCNGRPLNPLIFTAFTKEDFSGMTDAQIARAPVFESDVPDYNFHIVAAGTVVEAVFSFRNAGKSDLLVYKVGTDSPSAVCEDAIPAVPPGETASFKVRYDTAGAFPGEKLVLVTLVTNSPSRPYVNYFITGAVR